MKQVEEIIIREISELDKIVKAILSNSVDSRTILLEGEMGSGKTTVVSAFVKLLDSPEMVSSPTFSIVNDYSTSSIKIYHFDLYRLNSVKELQEIGFEEYLDAENYCFIEWPKLAIPFLSDNYSSIKISLEADGSRKFGLYKRNGII